MLNKLEKDTIEYDLKTLRWEIYKHKRKLIRDGHSDFDSILEINNKEKDLIKAMSLEGELRSLYEQILYIKRNISTIKKSTAKIILVDLETALNKIEKNQRNCFNTKMYYLASILVIL